METGKLMMQFDNDEPQELLPIEDYGEVSFNFQQVDPKKGALKGGSSQSMEFASAGGTKRFKLFISDKK